MTDEANIAEAELAKVATHAEMDKLILRRASHFPYDLLDYGLVNAAGFDKQTGTLTLTALGERVRELVIARMLQEFHDLRLAILPFARIEVPFSAEKGTWVARTLHCNNQVTAHSVWEARLAYHGSKEMP